MIFRVFASDFDGTIAENGRVTEGTAVALAQVRDSGRAVILVTGRTLEDLQQACPEYSRLFTAIVAENGACLYLPETREVRTLGAAPEPVLLSELRRQGVAFETGGSSIHTDAAAAEAALAAIRATGVDRTLVFNRGSLMLLPGGVAKGSGLKAALAAVGGSLHNVVGVGDGENDHAFLRESEYAVAVADAVPALRERADYVTRAPGPRGVVEFIDEHLLQDLPDLARRVPRHQVRLGERRGGPVTLPVHGTNLLVVGPPGSGKSTLAGVLVERLVESGRSGCLLDPEGDYASLGELQGVVTLGGKGGKDLPTPQDLEPLFRHPNASLVLNLSRMSRADKIEYGTKVLTAVSAVRSVIGMPHWLMIDEAHHLMPAQGSPVAQLLAPQEEGVYVITLEASALPPGVLGLMTTLAASGAEEFHRAVRALGWNGGRSREVAVLQPGEMVLAHRGDTAQPVRFAVDPRRSAHRRHVRKYAEGELPPDRSFYFRGPQSRLNLRAANLIRFRELAEGVDETTWEYHRRRGDYSAWIRDSIKDPDLAKEAEAAEKAEGSPADSRRRLLESIRRRYSV